MVLICLCVVIPGISQSVRMNIPRDLETGKVDLHLKSAQAGMNLAPYQPSGWDDRLVVSTVKGTRTSAASIDNTQVVYLDWAVISEGSENITASFVIKVFVDNTLVSYSKPSLLNSGFYLFRSDVAVGPLSGGTHQIKIVADVNNDIAETSETDNEYVRNITVQTSNIPDIYVSPSSKVFYQSGAQSQGVPAISYDKVVFIPSVPDSLLVKTIIDKNGNKVEVIKVPGSPPRDYRMTAASITTTSVMLDNVPAYTWSYGCSPTAASMIAGYYDHHGYPNMYAGPTNGGIVPFTNGIWGIAEHSGEIRNQCPLSATRNGLDGRTTRGHVDDYWVANGSSAEDPYITNGWTQHVYGECTGDFMKTSQSAFGNMDGSTSIYNGSGGTRYTGTHSDDGGYGFELFANSRGYTLQTRYNQYIKGYNGNTSGYTFDQYVAEINAGRPVMIHLTGHSVVGVGYDLTGNLVYIHDTWDNLVHSMTWGGLYSDLTQYAVSVFQLTPSNLLTINNVSSGNLSVTSVSSDKNWLSFTPQGSLTLSGWGSRSLQLAVDWSKVYGLSDTARITILSNDPDEPVTIVKVAAIPSSCTLEVTPLVRNVPSSPAGSVSFSVTSGCSWIATSDQSWCNVTPSGSGNGNITANYLANSGGSQRTATITVTASGHAPVTVAVVQNPGTANCVTVEAYVYLEGALMQLGGSANYGTLMRTNLYNTSILPGQCFADPIFGTIWYSPAGQPYSKAPWNYPGTEGALYDSGGNPANGKAGYASTVVDWVLVSLRDKPDASGVTLGIKAGLLHSDGHIEFPGGAFTCCNMNSSASYHIVIEHRNHLIVMSDAVPVVTGKVSFDFRNHQSYIDTSWGTDLYVGQKPISSGRFVMVAGNGDQIRDAASDTDMSMDDRTWWESHNGNFGLYRSGDYDLSGDTNMDDRGMWERSNGKFTSVPR
jgi:YD repeat-containing protein